MNIRGFIGLGASILVPFLLFVYLQVESSLDIKFIVPRGHFYIVSLVAILSTIIAIVVGISGSRLRNIKVTFLSLAFVSLAGLFAIHGLSTPNFLIHATHLPGLAAQLSVMVASLWLWLSSISSDHSFITLLSRWHKLLLPVWTSILILVGFTSMLNPHMVHFIPLDVYPINWTLATITILFNIIAIYRYYQSYRYSRFPLQISIVFSSGWLIVSQVIMILGETWRLSWWIYHILLLISMIVMLIGLFKQYAANKSLIGAFRALFTNDPVERITNSISPSVKALVVATEKRDTYTAGHNFRVTMYALRLAEEMQLKPEQLRAIAQGAIVHDIGKINIPDHILNKPGRLTEEERMAIEKHPIIGFDMCKSLGFMKEELSIIRSHHEKWDGSGYPDRLKGDQIPLLARISAVADVYDALTSNRSYRKAWSHAEAMKFLDEHKGTHFESACVEAWVRLCERDPSVYQLPSRLINEETTDAMHSFTS